MFGSAILDVAVGLVFVYLLVSIICSAVREGIEAWMKSRAVYLEHGIRQLLQDRDGKGLAHSVFTHPLIFGLFSGDYVKGDNTPKPSVFKRGKDLPSYIPATNFAMALMDIATRGPAMHALASNQNARPISLENVRQNILNIQSPAIQRVLLTAIDSAAGDLAKAQKNIEAWYDSSMDRVSGWYKRSTQNILLVIALAVTAGMNIDTIDIVRFLYKDDAARAAAVKAAESARVDSTYEKAKADLKNLKLPIGWEGRVFCLCNPGALWSLTYPHLFGWFLTALAASLGAPFWFDILNKIMVIRSTVKPHEKSPEEASEDRQVKKNDPSPPIVVTPSTSGTGGTSGPQASPGGIAGQSEEDLDGCEVNSTTGIQTLDEQLPAAEGGVQ